MALSTDKIVSRL